MGSSVVFLCLLFLLVIGFGIKLGVVPLHFWLPLAHPVAPTPASAVLSGAMIKAGLLGWMRFLPLGEVAMPKWGAPVNMEFDYSVQGDKITVPAAVKYFGSAGEEYFAWDPDATSPKITAFGAASSLAT